MSGYASGALYTVGLILGAISPMLALISVIGILFGIVFNIGVAITILIRSIIIQLKTVVAPIAIQIDAI